MCNLKSLVTTIDQHHLENENAINGSKPEVTSSQKEIDYNDNNNLNTSSTGEKSEENSNPLRNLRNLALKNLFKIIIGHLNVNPIRNKINVLKAMTEDNIDILVISETKIDKSFPVNQFSIDGYYLPYRLDRNQDGKLKTDLPGNVEGIFLDMNMHNKKWLIFVGYNPKKEHIAPFLSHVGKSLDYQIGKYENLILIGDFNSQMEENTTKEFCDTYNLINLTTEPTCFKNAQNPTLIDLILTNKPKRFHSSMCIETGISDFHKMTVCVLNVQFTKLCPAKIKYRNYKKFNLNFFKAELKTNLEFSEKTEITYNKFKDTFMKSLKKHAPMKEKLIRGNNAPFMNKILSKAFMHRAKLKNKYNTNPSEINHLHYKKQRNYCVNLLNKTKKEYYTNLDLSIFKDNKTFWKNIRPLFSDKQKDVRGILF